MPIDNNNDIVLRESSNKVAGLYNIGKTIGKGHFAVVKEARHVFTQEKVAIKIIDKTKLDKVSRDQLLSEVMCMKLVQHPNIIRLYEIIDTVNKLYLVLELGDGGDLYDYLLTNGSNGLPEEEAKHYFRQILRALAYCHKLHVVHRDIKPENVVFFKQSELVKLTDFGFSNKFTPGETLNTSCGSLAYSAPEILLGDSYDAPKVDIWSLGVILYMLVIGSLPFNETNDSETIANIMDCKYTVPSRISELCRRLIGKMLKRDANQRASLDVIINDEWLKCTNNSLEYEIENYSIPLISQEHLTLEEHIEILTKMSEGNISSVEETQTILDNGAFNHISATYFLLAERKLKRNYVDKYIQLKSKRKFETGNKEENNTICGKLNQTIAKQLSFEASRRISMILEGEETEENEEIDAMVSLATVRRDLEVFMEGGDGEKQTTGTTTSRCVSRISSVYDLHSISDGDESDNGLISIRSKAKLMQKSYRSFSSFGGGGQLTSNNNNNQLTDELIQEIINDIVNNSSSSSFSFSSQKPISSSKRSSWVQSKPLAVRKRSQSAADISSRRNNNNNNNSDDLDPTELTSNLHKFSVAANNGSVRRANSNCKYAAVQQVAMNERRYTQVLFDTGSNSTSANCSSPDISDVEIDPKTKIRFPKNTIKKMDSRTSDVFDHHDICEPINEEDELNKSHNLVFPNNASHDHHSNYCFRSRSFDGRFANMIQIDNTNEKPTIVLKSKKGSWDSNSISRRFADSNFSLSSFASKLDQPNIMQLIRGTYELQIRNIHDHSDGTKSLHRVSNQTDQLPFVIIPETPSKQTSPKLSTKNINIVYKKLKKSTLKLKLPFLTTNSEKSSKELLNDHSKTDFSNSCNILSSGNSSNCDIHKVNSISNNTNNINNNDNNNSNPQLTFSNKIDNNGCHKEKSNLISFKRDHLACCLLS